MAKRSETWLQTWYRPLTAGLAAIGFSLTTYLTVTHFLGQKAALCNTEGAGCGLVLNSEYAKIFGIPLTVFGAAAYLGLGSLALVSFLWKKPDPKQQQDWQELTGFLLFLRYQRLQEQVRLIKAKSFEVSYEDQKQINALEESMRRLYNDTQKLF